MQSSRTETLIDAGPLIAFHSKRDSWHNKAISFFQQFRGKIFTSEPVVTEVMWHLAYDWRSQNEFLSDLQSGLITNVGLISSDFEHIAELNRKCRDRPAEFADLSIVALARRLNIYNVISLDSDFEVYRTESKRKFHNLFPKWDQ